MNSFSIYINNECNLECTYCSVNKGFIKLCWSEGIEKLLVSMITTEGEKKRIGIIGGEPLLNQEFIIHLISYLNRIRPEFPNKKIYITAIPTNGTIYNRGFYELLRDNDIELQFSVDNFLYNRVDEKRIHKDIKNYNLYTVIEKNIKLYTDIFGKPPRINITLNETNIDHFYSLVQYYIEIIGITGIYFCFVIASKKKIFKLKFLKEYLKVFEYYCKNVTKHQFEIMPIEEVIKDYLACDDFSISKLNPCGLGKEPVLSYNGLIYSCDLIASKGLLDEKYILGSIQDGIHADFLRGTQENFISNKPLHSESFREKFELEKMHCLSYGVTTQEAKDAQFIFEYIYKIPFLGIKKLSPDIIKYIKDKYGLYSHITGDK